MNVLRTEPTDNRDVTVESRPDVVTLRRLQNVRGFPAVSILLSTSPSERLVEADAAALGQLVDQAVGRLRAEAPEAGVDLNRRLRILAGSVASAPTDQALALYVHADHSEVVRLPNAVRSRVVVAETFATGDLVMGFRHAPHYLLLLLGDNTTRLFNGYGRRVEERNAEVFRTVNPWRGASDLRSVGWDVDASAAYAARQRSYLRRIDAALDAVHDAGAVPLVLAGDPSLGGAFLELTSRPERVVGTVPCDGLRTGLDAIGRLADRLMAGHLGRRRQHALAILDKAGSPERSAAGIAAVWQAAVRGEGVTLLVDESVTVPARIGGDGLELRPAAPEGGRGVVADVIGELASAVTFYGGEIIVVPAGTLSTFDGIALTLRSPRAQSDRRMG